ncbi:MAG: hypothetical protein EPO07_04525 [Verrucomicrobia bacterium]|nr:MAG: hypothetical protein EPO07_04525 [Verrucomicrobiota bacterium]
MKIKLSTKPLVSISLGLLLSASFVSAQTNAGGERVNTPGAPVQLSERQQAAVAAIKKLGGEVRFDRDRNRANDLVDLDNTPVTDADLVHLAELTSVKRLSLRFTKVTGAGFEHLKGLTNLTTVYLSGSTVGDVGLEQLKGVPTLVNLIAQQSKITDAGLEHLKGQTNLRTLNLERTEVTEAGVKELQQSLPNCKTTR